MKLTVGAELLASSGKYLVTVGLVSHVPDDAVFGRVVNVMKRHGNLYGTKAGGQMTGVDRQLFDDVLPQLLAECRQLFHLQFLQVVRGVYFME